MRNHFVIPILAILAMPIATSADDAASVKKQVEANYARMMDAFKKHDIDGVMSVAADDYVGTGEDGKPITKAQAAAQMKQYMKESMKINSWKYTVTGLKVSGNKATGAATFDLDADTRDSQGMLGPKGKRHRIAMVENYNTTWTKTGGKWLISKEMLSSPPKMMVDGKPFNPTAPVPPKPAKK